MIFEGQQAFAHLMFWEVFSFGPKEFIISMRPTSALVSPSRRRHILGQCTRDEKTLALKRPPRTGALKATDLPEPRYRMPVERETKKIEIQKNTFIFAFHRLLFAHIVLSSMCGPSKGGKAVLVQLQAGGCRAAAAMGAE